MIFLIFTGVFGSCHLTSNRKLPWSLPRIPNVKLPLGHNIRYVLFTDQEFTFADTGRWEVVKISDVKETSRRTARWIKIEAYQTLLKGYPHDFSVWIDSNVHLRPKFIDFLLTLGPETPIISLVHPRRRCTYDEIEYCFRKGMSSDLSLFKRQRKAYKRLKFPPHHGLAETRILIRPSTLDPVFGETWWSIFERFHNRDQCSFMVALWILKLPYSLIHPSHILEVDILPKDRKEAESKVFEGLRNVKSFVMKGFTGKEAKQHLYHEKIVPKTTPTAPKALRQDRF